MDKIVSCINKYSTDPKKDRIYNVELFRKLFRQQDLLKTFHKVNPKWIKIIHHVFSELFSESSGTKPSKPMELKMTITIIDELSKQICYSPHYLSLDDLMYDLVHLMDNINLQLFEKNFQLILSRIASCKFYTIEYDNVLMVLKKISKQNIAAFPSWFIFSKFLEFSQVNLQELYNHYSERLLNKFDYRFPILYWILVNLSADDSYLTQLLELYLPILRERTFKSFELSSSCPYFYSEKFSPCHFNWKRSFIEGKILDKRDLFDYHLQKMFLTNTWNDEAFLYCISNIIAYLDSNNIEKQNLCRSYMVYAIKELESFLIRSETVSSSSGELIDIKLPWSLIRLFSYCFVNLIHLSKDLEETFSAKFILSKCVIETFESLCESYLYQKFKWLKWPIKMLLLNKLYSKDENRNLLFDQISNLINSLEKIPSNELSHTLKYLLFILEKIKRIDIETKDIFVSLLLSLTSIWTKMYAFSSKKRFRVNTRFFGESLILLSIKEVLCLMYKNNLFIMESEDVIKIFVNAVKDRYFLNSYLFPYCFLSVVVEMNLVFPRLIYDFVENSNIISSLDVIFELLGSENLPDNVKKSCLTVLKETFCDKKFFLRSHSVLFMKQESIDNLKKELITKLFEYYPQEYDDVNFSQIIVVLTKTGGTSQSEEAIRSLANALNEFTFTEIPDSTDFTPFSKRQKTNSSRLNLDEAIKILSIDCFPEKSFFDYQLLINKCLNLTDEDQFPFAVQSDTDKENLLETTVDEKSENIACENFKMLTNKFRLFSQILSFLFRYSIKPEMYVNMMISKIDENCQNFQKLMPYQVDWLLRAIDCLLAFPLKSTNQVDTEVKDNLVSVLIRSLEMFREQIFLWNNNNFIYLFANAALELAKKISSYKSQSKESLVTFIERLSQGVHDLFNYDDKYYLTPFQVSMLLNLKRADQILVNGEEDIVNKAPLPTQNIIRKIFMDPGLYFDAFMEIFNFYTVDLANENTLKEFLELWHEKGTFIFKIGESNVDLSIPLMERMFQSFMESNQRSLHLLSLLLSHVFIYFNKSHSINSISSSPVHLLPAPMVKMLHSVLPHLLYKILIQFLLKQDDFVKLQNLRWLETFSLDWSIISSNYRYVIKAVDLFLPLARVSPFREDEITSMDYLRAVLVLLSANSLTDDLRNNILEKRNSFEKLLTNSSQLIEIFSVFFYKFDSMEMVFDSILSLLYKEENISISYSRWITAFLDPKISYNLVLKIIAFASKIFSQSQPLLITTQENVQIRSLEAWSIFVSFISNKIEKPLPEISRKKFLAYICETFEISLYNALVIDSKQDVQIICLLLGKIGKFSTKLARHLNGTSHLESLTRLLLEVPFRVRCPVLFESSKDLLIEILSRFPVKMTIEEIMLKYLGSILSTGISTQVKSFYKELENTSSEVINNKVSMVNRYSRHGVYHHTWSFINILTRLKEPNLSKYPLINYKNENAISEEEMSALIRLNVNISNNLIKDDLRLTTDLLQSISRDLVVSHLDLTESPDLFFNLNPLTLILTKIIVHCNEISMNAYHSSSYLACETMEKMEDFRDLLSSQYTFDEDFRLYASENLPLLIGEDKNLKKSRTGPKKTLSYSNYQKILRRMIEIVTNNDDLKQNFLRHINVIETLFQDSFIAVFVPLALQDSQLAEDVFQWVFIEIYCHASPMTPKETEEILKAFNQIINQTSLNNSSILVKSFLSLQFYLQHYSTTEETLKYRPILDIDWLKLSEFSHETSYQMESRACLEFHWLSLGNYDNKAKVGINQQEALFIHHWYRLCQELDMPDHCIASQIHFLNSRPGPDVREILKFSPDETFNNKQKQLSLHKLSDWQQMNIFNMPGSILQKIEYTSTPEVLVDIWKLNQKKDIDASLILNKMKMQLYQLDSSEDSFAIFKFLVDLSSDLKDGERLLWFSREAVKNFEDPVKTILSRIAYTLAGDNETCSISRLITARILDLTEEQETLSNLPQVSQIYLDLVQLTSDLPTQINMKLGIAKNLLGLDEITQRLCDIQSSKRSLLDARIKGSLMNMLSECLEFLATQLDTNELKNLDEIICDIVKPKVDTFNSWVNFQERQEKDVVYGLKAIAKNWHILAEFSDKNYQNYNKYLNSSDFIHREQLLERTRENLKIFEEIEKNNNQSALRRFLYRQSQLEIVEINELRKLKAHNYELTMKALCECLTLSQGHKVKIYKFIHYWLFQNDPDVSFNVDPYLDRIPAGNLINLFPQLLGKLCSLNDIEHEPTKKTDQLFTLLTRIIFEYPLETVYNVISTINSDWDRNAKNASTAKKKSYFSSTKLDNQEKSSRSLSAEKLFLRVLSQYDDDGNTEMKSILQNIQQLFKAYYQLAIQSVSEQEKASRNLTIDSNLLIISLQRYSWFQKLPVISLSTRTKDFLSDKAILNIKLDKKFTILTGISQPKLIEVLCSDGRNRKQLVKGRDDPKQDSVMQQIFSVANKILKNDIESPSGSLITTYRVVALSSLSAVIEFVEDTMTLSDYLAHQKTGAHVKYRPGDSSLSAARLKLSNAHTQSPASKLLVFREVCSSIKPVFGYFFSEFFANPESCFIAKKTYSVSLSVASIIGYILGLGDRHPSNILIRTSTASLIHIDLGIAFDQGKYLPYPETVPFRLTRDLIHALGPYGVSTSFSTYGKMTLLSLMKSRDVIETLLQTLLDDPLFNWCLTPDQLVQFEKKRQKSSFQTGSFNELSFPMSLSLKSSNQSEASFATGVTHQMAIEVIDKVRRKLQGFGHSSHGSISEQSEYSADAIIERLINEATSEVNLSKMFHGWQAYL